MFAVTTYLTVSVVFFFVGHDPRPRHRAAATYRGCGGGSTRLLSLGWQGTADQWRHYDAAYLFLAAFATPLVLSVHSVVSWDFAVASSPAGTRTIFAPYFVAGAIFSGRRW